jgi:hypothetical protein
MVKGCLIDAEGFAAKAPRLVFFRRKGISTVPLDQEEVYGNYGFENTRDYTGNIIALLGEEGWELVSAVPTGATGAHALYFKRPRETGEETP